MEGWRVDLSNFAFFFFVNNSLQMSHPISYSILLEPIVRVIILPIHLIVKDIGSHNNEFAVPCLHLTAFLVMLVDLQVLVTVESKPVTDQVCPLRIIGIPWEDLIVPLKLLNCDFAFSLLLIIHIIFITVFLINVVMGTHLLEIHIEFLVYHIVFFQQSL